MNHIILSTSKGVYGWNLDRTPATQLPALLDEIRTIIGEDVYGIPEQPFTADAMFRVLFDDTPDHDYENALMDRVIAWDDMLDSDDYIR